MITAIIVISSIVLAAVFTIAWLRNPALRRQIEHPKHCFQDQVRQHDQIYNRQQHKTSRDVKGQRDESL